jgi:hypothetical protein
VNPVQLKDLLLDWTVANSGAEERNYLGMSAIGRCPRQLYDQMVGARTWNLQGHQLCYLGYLFERDVLARLQAINADLLGGPREFSDFGGRFQGHSDGEWDGDLLEIKSTTAETVREIKETRRVPHDHYWQVQTYMHYGNYRRATVIYVARDRGDVYVASVPRNHRVGERARLKAATILEAVDHRQPPEGECGYCRVS